MNQKPDDTQKPDDPKNPGNSQTGGKGQSTGKTPGTGDYTTVVPFALAILACGGAVTVLSLKKKARLRAESK